MRSMKLLPALLAVLLSASGASGQSLGDLAKKTAADREKAKTATAAPKEATPAAKVYTDADLKTLEPMPSDVPAAPPAPVAEATAPAPSKPADTTLMPTQGEPKAEAYWKDKMRGLETRLTADDAQLTAAASRLREYEAALSESQRAINGEVYVDRTLKAQVLATRDEVSRLRATVASDRSQIAALEEEARRAGVPPGWLR
jgi:cell division protein FtsB